MPTNYTLDLSNYKDRFGGYVEPGRYHVIVEDFELGKSKAKNDKIVLWLRVLDKGDYAGTTLVTNLAITEAAMFRVVNFLTAIGLPTPRKPINLQLDKFIGRQLMVDVDDGEPYAGKIPAEVRGFVKLPDSMRAAADEVEDLDDDDADELDDLEEDELNEEYGPDAVEGDDDYDGDESDDVYEDDDEPEPAPVKRKRKPAPEPVSDDVADLEGDEPKPEPEPEPEPKPAARKRRLKSAPEPAPVVEDDDGDIEEVDLDDIEL